MSSFSGVFDLQVENPNVLSWNILTRGPVKK